MKRLCCLLAGLLLSAGLLLYAVCVSALDEPFFQNALIQTVNTDELRISREDLALFSRETIPYLRGETDTWKPALSLAGIPADQAIPAAFYEHMADIRQVFIVVSRLWPILLGLGVLSAGMLFLLKKFSPAAFRVGLLIPMTVTAGLLLFALLDFETFWRVLHQTLIPGGIFSAREPVMRLFPITLFVCYVKPVVLRLLGGGLVLGLISGLIRHYGAAVQKR